MGSAATGRDQEAMNIDLHPKLARHLAEVLRELRRRHARRWRRAAAKPSPERIHQLRVETRRLLALVDLVHATGEAKSLRKLRKSLKRRLDDFDPLRDLHVCQGLLKQKTTSGAELDALHELWTDREQRLARRLGRRLTAARYRKLKRRLATLQKGLELATRQRSSEPAAPGAHTLLEPLYQEVCRRAQRTRTPAGVHRLRVAFKKFRYACEMFRPLLAGLNRSHLEAMRKFHTLMGELQDTVVLRGAIKIDGPRAGLAPAVLRRLDRPWLDRQRELLARCQTALSQLPQWEPSKLARRRSS